MLITREIPNKGYKRSASNMSNTPKTQEILYSACTHQTVERYGINLASPLP
jgi:hypothetical protein